MLVLDRDNCVLCEVYAAYPQANGSWTAGSSAIFDLKSHALRPAGWTSADPAGLPILPGLVRYDEVASGEIWHAIRFTAPQTRRAYVWPGRHYASSLTGSQYPPMGQRFRLRAGYDISGAPDQRWNNDNLHQLSSLSGAQFEAVDVSGLQLSADSGQVRVRGGAASTPTSTRTPTATPTRTVTATPTRTPTPGVAATPTPTQAGAKVKSFQNGVVPSTSYAGNIDTYVAEATPAANYGAAMTVVVTGSDPAAGKDRWALLKWDLSSISGWVQSATMTLNITDHSAGQTYELYEALASWSETTVTWGSKPARGSVVLGVAAPNKTGTLVVTLNAGGLAALQRWLNTPGKNFGFYLVNTANTDTLAFDSSEVATATLRPKLSVTYKPPILTKGPWIESPTATSANALWETDIYGKGTVSYRVKGTSTWSSKTAATTLVSGKWQAKAALTGLAAKTTYEYRVRASADSAWTSIATFATTAAVTAVAPTGDMATGILFMPLLQR